jgi:hypothetical protein
MSIETPEGCPFSAKTHVRADGMGISRIYPNDNVELPLHKWKVEFDDNTMSDSYTDLGYWDVQNLPSMSWDIITREEYARLNSGANLPEIPDSSPADPWAKSPITKEEVWLRGYCAAIPPVPRATAAKWAVQEFEEEFLKL